MKKGKEGVNFLPAPTAEKVANVIPELTDKWSRTTLMALHRLEEAIAGDDGLGAKYWATAAGIGTDKIMPLKGMPTQIVSNLHAHRHEIGDVMDKLAVAARVLTRHEQKGYRPARVLEVKASE